MLLAHGGPSTGRQEGPSCRAEREPQPIGAGAEPPARAIDRSALLLVKYAVQGRGCDCLPRDVLDHNRPQDKAVLPGTFN